MGGLRKSPARGPERGQPRRDVVERARSDATMTATARQVSARAASPFRRLTMRTGLIAALGLVIFLLAGLAGPPVAPAQKSAPPARVKWEYAMYSHSGLMALG